jgi:hypothetical protein
MTGPRTGINAAITYMGTTMAGGTETAEGIIPHYRLPDGLDAPVRVIVSLRGSTDAPMPERDSRGRLVYALPGGGRFAA